MLIYARIDLVVLFCVLWFNSVASLKDDEPRKKQRERFDFVIVGGGTAGTVLATRLSEITSWKILLLEAGELSHKLNDVPADSTMYLGTSLDWRYEIEEQKSSCRGLKNRKSFWTAGKGVGGTSQINYMAYTRGNKEDYNRWAKQGNPGWSYDEVLPYFLKSEKYAINKYIPKYHNRKGLLNIENPCMTNLTNVFLNGAGELGHRIHDYNGPVQLRFSRIKVHTLNGKRHSVSQAFFDPVYGKRKNLMMLGSAHVIKVQVNPSTKRAEGIVFKRNNATRKVVVKKEVILSAGVVGSTKLLMLSGIGPKKHLEDLHIPLVQNLKVGEGIRDHVSYFGLNYLTNLQRDDNYTESSSFSQKSVASCPAGIEAIGFVRLNNSKTERMVPDVEILSVNHVINRNLKLLTNMDDAIYQKCFQIAERYIGANIFPILLHPKSEGFIKLRSKNPQDPPIIQPNYFSNHEDVTTMVEAIKFVEKLTKTRSFVNADAALYPVPVCDNYQMYSAEYWQCAVKTLTMSFHDYMGGCKMGPNADEGAVVDSKLQVHGITNLMVVDASVIPVTISGHIEAATIMIAEKAADIIKDKYNSTYT